MLVLVDQSASPSRIPPLKNLSKSKKINEKEILLFVAAHLSFAYYVFVDWNPLRRPFSKTRSVKILIAAASS